MADAKVMLVGLGGLGGQIGSMLGMMSPDALHLVDGDVVDAATAVRVAGAFAAAGESKVETVGHTVLATQPYTRLTRQSVRVGHPRDPEDGETADVDVSLRAKIADCNLVIDATADESIQHWLSDACRPAGIGYLRAEALPGVWSGLIALQRPDGDVCWVCWQHALMDGRIPELPQDPRPGVQPPGCAEPTYRGAGFDLAAIAAQTVRVAASYLTRDDDGYGPLTHDVMTVRFRTEDGAAVLPQWQGHDLSRHPACTNHDW